MSDPDDPLEREADRVADRVMRTPDPTALHDEEDDGSISRGRPAIARKCKACEHEDLMRSEAPGSASTLETTSNTAGTIERSRATGGRQLPAGVRAFMEPRFGRDFSRVRFHDDLEADRLASSLRARAFTVGRDIFFARGEYRQNTSEGRRLLAHELTHTVQQLDDGPRISRAPREHDEPEERLRMEELRRRQEAARGRVFFGAPGGVPSVGIRFGRPPRPRRPSTAREPSAIDVDERLRAPPEAASPSPGAIEQQQTAAMEAEVSAIVERGVAHGFEGQTADGLRRVIGDAERAINRHPFADAERKEEMRKDLRTIGSVLDSPDTAARAGRAAVDGDDPFAAAGAALLPRAAPLGGPAVAALGVLVAWYMLVFWELGRATRRRPRPVEFAPPERPEIEPEPVEIPVPRPRPVEPSPTPPRPDPKPALDRIRDALPKGEVAPLPTPEPVPDSPGAPQPPVKLPKDAKRRRRRRDCKLEDIDVQGLPRGEQSQRCAEKIAPNRKAWRNWQFVGQKGSYDALSAMAPVLWEFKVQRFSEFPEFIQEQERAKSIPQATEEAKWAERCGYGYVWAAADQFHLEEAKAWFSGIPHPIAFMPVPECFDL